MASGLVYYCASLPLLLLLPTPQSAFCLKLSLILILKFFEWLKNPFFFLFYYVCLVIGCFPRLVRALVYFILFFALKIIIFKGAKNVVLLKQMAKNDIIYIY